MPQVADQQPQAVATPLWRRVTAFFGLGTMVIATGLVLGGLIAFTALMLVFLVERAIA